METMITFTETVTGSRETPPTGSPATGSGTETLNTTKDHFTWTVSWSGLTAPFTAAHFHMAPPGVQPATAGLLGVGMSLAGIIAARRKLRA